MTDDPAGYYATLEVDPAAPPEAITAAFRRKARVLHPDMPGTGDQAAFVRLSEAYEVLGDAGRRAAYDRSAEKVNLPTVEEPAPRGPRLSDLPVAAWAGLGGLLCLATVMTVLQLSRQRSIPQGPVIRPFAPSTVTQASAPQRPAVASTTGPTTHYVLPGGSDAVLWRRDNDTYRPAGRVGAFTPVLALGLLPEHGLMAVGLTDGGTGFVDATRLAPGDNAAARRAYCAYNAGPLPQNGAILGRHGDGTARLEISNRAAQPAVVKLRDASGLATATVFISPGSSTVVENLPDKAYRPDFAIGELWSSACGSFAAGMRAERFAFTAAPSGLSPLVIPPDLSAAFAPADIPDAAFEHE